MHSKYIIDEFKDGFFNLTTGWSWEIQGFIDQENRVYPIDSDTKVLSTVFERLVSPVIRSLAKKKSYIVEIANQTTYPDFTLTLKDGDNVIHRIALDIKTTYAEKKDDSKYKKMNFTLGSYNSFLVNNTKNILYPYSTYSDHWILGFIYSRAPAFEEYDLDSIPKRGEIKCPYDIESVFITEKVKITGLRAGSGNTKNIGSVKLDTPLGFENHNGPFTKFSKSKFACDHYWKYYEDYKKEISTEEELIGHPDFQKFL